MDPFSYLSVLISIILGLAIAQLLSGIGRLLQARDRVRLYWPSLAWTGLLPLIDIQTWWSMFGLREHHEWNFFGFLIVLTQPIVLILRPMLDARLGGGHPASAQIVCELSYWNRRPDRTARWMLFTVTTVLQCTPSVTGSSRCSVHLSIAAG